MLVRYGVPMESFQIVKACVIQLGSLLPGFPRWGLLKLAYHTQSMTTKMTEHNHFNFNLDSSSKLRGDCRKEQIGSFHGDDIRDLKGEKS